MRRAGVASTLAGLVTASLLSALPAHAAPPAGAPAPAASTASTASAASTASTRPAALAAPGSVRVAATTHHALKLTWSTVKGATSYRVLRRPAGAKTFHTVATLHSAQRTTWTDRTTKSATVYLYRIQACAAPGCSPRSRWVSAVTTGSTKLTNATGVRIYATTGTTWNMSMQQFSASLLPGYESRNPDAPSAVLTSPAAHAQGRWPVSGKLRFVSSNPAVATVNYDGVVQALRLGTTTITAIAHNGLTRSFTVVVRDYAHPKFDYSVIAPTGLRTWFQAHSTQAGDVVDYILEKHPNLSDVTVTLNSSGQVVSSISLPSALKAEVTAMMTDPGYPLTITSQDSTINFKLGNVLTGTGYISYYPMPTSLPSACLPAPYWLWGYYRNLLTIPTAPLPSGGTDTSQGC